MERTVSAQLLAIRTKLFGNRAFPQNFHTRELGERTLFFAVEVIPKTYFDDKRNYTFSMNKQTIRLVISNVVRYYN